MLAAERGDAYLVKAMIEAGADPAARDYQGKTSLHAAITIRAKEVIDALLEHPESIITTNINGNTPAHAAIRAGDINTLRRLLTLAPELRMRSHGGSLLELATTLLEDPVMLRHLWKQAKQASRRGITTDELRECIAFLQTA